MWIHFPPLCLLSHCRCLPSDPDYNPWLGQLRGLPPVLALSRHLSQVTNSGCFTAQNINPIVMLKTHQYSLCFSIHLFNSKSCASYMVGTGDSDWIPCVSCPIGSAYLIIVKHHYSIQMVPIKYIAFRCWYIYQLNLDRQVLVAVKYSFKFAPSPAPDSGLT